MRIRDNGRGAGLRPGQPGRVGRPRQALGRPVIGGGQLSDLARVQVHGQQPAIVEGGRDRSPVRGGGQAGDRSAETFEPNGPWLTSHGGHFQRVLAGRVGDPHHLPGLAQHPGQPGPRSGVHVQRPGRAVLVRQPVHAPPHLHHTGLPGPVRVQLAQVIPRGDQPRRPRRGGRAEADVEFHAGRGRPGRPAARCRPPRGRRSAVRRCSGYGRTCRHDRCAGLSLSHPARTNRCCRCLHDQTGRTTARRSASGRPAAHPGPSAPG